MLSAVSQSLGHCFPLLALFLLPENAFQDYANRCAGEYNQWKAHIGVLIVLYINSSLKIVDKITEQVCILLHKLQCEINMFTFKRINPC